MGGDTALRKTKRAKTLAEVVSPTKDSFTKFAKISAAALCIIELAYKHLKLKVNIIHWIYHSIRKVSVNGRN